MPSLYPTIATTLCSGFVLLSRRQVPDAAITSLNTIGLAVVGDQEPFVRTVLYRPSRTRAPWDWWCSSQPQCFRQENPRRPAVRRDP